MSRMAEAYQDQQEQQNLSGLNDCEEYDYHHAEVCVYCGERRGDKLQCCSEVHFDTQFNIDQNEKWHKKNHRILNKIHQIVKTKIKPRTGHQVQPLESRSDSKPF